MQISAINTINTAKKTNTNFNGLWGNTIKHSGVGNCKWQNEIYDYETKEYYPFADECLEALSNVQKEHSTYKKTKNSNADCFIYTGTNISIKPYLLFTKRQWFDYISNKLSISSCEVKFIEKNLKNLHLERYLRA